LPFATHVSKSPPTDRASSCVVAIYAVKGLCEGRDFPAVKWSQNIKRIIKTQNTQVKMGGFRLFVSRNIPKLSGRKYEEVSSLEVEVPPLKVRLEIDGCKEVVCALIV